MGALLDAEAAEDFVTNLILSVRSLLPVDKVRVVGGGGGVTGCRDKSLAWPEDRGHETRPALYFTASRMDCSILNRYLCCSW